MNMIEKLQAVGEHDMSADAYHADPCPAPSLSSGIANILLSRSPRHARAAHPRLNPDFQQHEDSRMDIGSYAHALILEHDDSRLVIVDADDWRTKAAKEARDAAWAVGKLPLLAKKSGEVHAMVHAAREYIARSELLRDVFADGGASEKVCIWREGDAWCRSRMDRVNADRSVIVDYKTTDNAHPSAFARKIINMGYDVQDAFYSRGLRAINGGTTPNFFFLVQEIESPYACALVALSESFVTLAESKVARAIKIWQRCMTNNAWPAYPMDAAYVEAPNWAIYENEMQEEAT